jgi:alkaline phosphatase
MPLDPHPPAGHQPRLRRRSFLQLAAAVAAGGALSGADAGVRGVPLLRPAATGRGAGKARNVIFMVSDGMSFGTLTLADMFRRQHDGRGSHWLSLFGRAGVRRGLYATDSADSLVTDSSASGSCWGCGHRVNNSVVNITPDGTQRMPLLVQAAQSGKATGLVSTARVTHATPASFIANSVRRDWEGPIAEQLLERRVDVALGGGAKFFKDDLLNGQNDLVVVRDRAGLLKSGEPTPGRESKRLLGLFSEAHVPFVLDRADTVPSLTEMTRAALHRLEGRSEGFVLQIEGGRVDHAAHSNDAPSLIREQLEFDDAIAEVVAWLDGGKRDDTLLVITSDHGNANPGLTVYGKDAREGFDRLANAKHSFEWIYDQLKPIAPSERPKQAPSIVERAMGVALDETEQQMLADALVGKRLAAFRGLTSLDSVMGGLLANHFGVSFVSGNHTSDRVEVTAMGPGSEDIAPVGHNTDLHGVVVAALGLAPGELLPDMKEKAEFPKPPHPD